MMEEIRNIVQNPNRFHDILITIAGILQYKIGFTNSKNEPSFLIDSNDGSQIELNIKPKHLNAIFRGNKYMVSESGTFIFRYHAEIQATLDLRSPVSGNPCLLVSRIDISLPVPPRIRKYTKQKKFNIKANFLRSDWNYRDRKFPRVKMEITKNRNLFVGKELIDIRKYQDFLNDWVWLEGTIENLVVPYSETEITYYVLKLVSGGSKQVSYIPIEPKFLAVFIEECVEVPPGGEYFIQNFEILCRLSLIQHQENQLEVGDFDALSRSNLASWLVLSDVQHIILHEKHPVFNA